MMLFAFYARVKSDYVKLLNKLTAAIIVSFTMDLVEINRIKILICSLEVYINK